ncbi:MAG: winged helix DNA-binding domain-containing protein [Acidimicrobiales bacterium]
MTQRFDDAQRRARMARRHRLARGAAATDPVEVARSLVALHSTDPATVYLSCLARMASGTTADVDRALYHDRSLVRMLGMRRTMFVVPAELEPVIDHACTTAIAALQRRRLVQLLETTGVARDGARWLARVEGETLAALEQRGQASGQELSAAVPALRTQISYGDASKKWANVSAVTTRVLFLLAAEGRIVRGPPRGSWISSQYRWVPRDRWLATPVATPSAAATAQARVALARHWLAAYGPAPVTDLQWWTGWTARETRAALAPLSVDEVDLGGPSPGLVLAGDAEPDESPATGPWVALLPALDPTVMGWTERSWFLPEGPLRSQLFDRSGNPGPSIWCDGLVVGGWAQRGQGEIALRVVCDVGADARAAIDAEAERLRQALGDVRVTPRFRTPLERELSLS